jgi:C1A family cysteine protease
MARIIGIGLLFLSFVVFLETVAQSTSNNKIWSTYKATFKKTYSSGSEERIRMNRVLQKTAEIELHNKKFAQKLVSFKRQVTPYMDLSTEEYLKYRTGLLMPENEKVYFNNLVKNLKARNLKTPTKTLRSSLGACTPPADTSSVNWVTAGKVSPVKNQGQCGSCWAFAAIASIESELAKKFNKFYDLSEEQLNDCDTVYNNNGCNGGWPFNTLRYYATYNYIANETNYAYNQATGPNFQTCQRYKLRWPKVRVNQPLVDISPFGNERLNCSEANLKKLVNRGPVVVAIQSNCQGFGSTSTGVFSAAPNTCRDTVDHGVLVVGYGFDSTVCKNYWLVKNSWGTSYHDGGYIKIARAFDINDTTDPDYNTINIACYGMSAGYPWDYSSSGTYS